VGGTFLLVLQGGGAEFPLPRWRFKATTAELNLPRKG